MIFLPVCEAQQWLLQMPKGGSNINTEKLGARPSLIGRVGATSAAVISFKTNYIQRETHQFGFLQQCPPLKLISLMLSTIKERHARLDYASDYSYKNF